MHSTNIYICVIANLLREELNRVKSELVVLKSTDIPTDPELASLTQERDAL